MTPCCASWPCKTWPLSRTFASNCSPAFAPGRAKPARARPSLLQPAYQLQLLDAFGNLEPVRENYVTFADQVRDLRRRHALLTAERQQRLRELALLRFERDELDQANLRPGELAGLLRERE